MSEAGDAKRSAAALGSARPIVALGASAGGLEAFREFLRNTPACTGMAFVVVQHLDPRQPSIVPELLATHSALPVAHAADGMPIEPDHVYVLPPGMVLSVSSGLLRVRPISAGEQQSALDHFFHSLAEDQGENAVAIVLSGLGSDGTVGVRAIKDQGGLTLAQAPETARYDGMPKHAILSGLVDEVMPIDQMPARLIDYALRLGNLGDPALDRVTAEIEAKLPELLELLRERTGHDFSRYKKKTLARRIQRRLRVDRTGGYDAYLARLRTEQTLGEELVRDLLVGVTQFFRDPAAFDALRTQVLDPLVASRRGEIRIWVPGCSTGEEAYSIAILLTEAFDAAGVAPRAQIFATDLDERALDHARQGRFALGIQEALDPERLDRFFVRDGNELVIAQHIREMCIFSQHDLVQDPPFSRLDLVSCRNVLIYLEADLQARVLALFHYSLREGGQLLLGPSESASGGSDLFRSNDKTYRIFSKKRAHLPKNLGFRLSDGPRAARRAAELARRFGADGEQDLARTLESIVLDEFAPPAMVVNDRGDVLYVTGRTGKLIDPATGALTLNAVNLVHRQLRPDLRTALQEAIRSGEVVKRENLRVDTAAGAEIVDFTVRPLRELGDAGLFAIVFSEVGPTVAELGQERPAPDEGRLVNQLETELRSTKQHLQTMIEELETSNDELKSSNEELLSMNEELQSLNEEFETVNAELKRKVVELDVLNSDLDNLLRSTQIPTLFLDAELRIRRFTPATADIFHVIDSDLGRPITDLAARFPESTLPDDAREVLRTLRPREREVTLEASTAYVMRITPYRTLDNVIDGVVVTFVDVTLVKEAHQQRERLAAIVEGASEAIIAKTLDGTVTSWNRAAEQTYGFMAEEIIGKNVALIVPPERADELDYVLDRIRHGERVLRFETIRVRKDGGRLTVSLSVSPVFGASGDVIGASAIARNISAQKAADLALRASEQRYRSLVTASAAVVWTSDASGAFVSEQPTWQRFTGQTREEVLGWGWLDVVHPDDRDAVQQVWRRAVNERSSYECAFRIFNSARDRYRHVLGRAVPVLEGSGQAREWVGMLSDVTREHETLEALKARADELRAIFENSAAGLVESNAEGVIVRANRKFAEMTGYDLDELVGMQVRLLSHPDDRAEHVEAFRASIERGVPGYSGERRLVSKSGRIFYAQLSASILRDDSGEPERVIGVLQDITERKLVEADLRRAKLAAEEASHAKDQFLAVLSHELRTPLTPALAAAHKLERTEALSPDARSALRMIQRNIDLEARLIDDLLDLTRISRGRMTLRPAVVDASDVLAQALEIVSIDLDAKNLVASVSLGTGCFVKADAARLQQVFWNLLKNAIKFTPPGGELFASCRHDGEGRVVAEVRDTGIGIETRLLPHVFDAFEQGTRDREGLGLGLAISRALVELHGGQIVAESAGPGLGATFRVLLPETMEAPVATPPRRIDTPPQASGSALHVLLVEDHADSAQLMRELLELSGHRVEQASTVSEALCIADGKAFDLLLSDLGLPDGSGLELARLLREKGRVRHAIALSGYGMEEDLRRSREAGFEEHLVKPVNPRDLDATIRRVTGKGARA